MLSLVIPVYNEEDVIASTIDEARTVLSAANIEGFEIIVVDDGSTDDTAGRAKKADVTVISHPHNIGYGRSLKDGIRAARHDVIAISDGDGTYPLDRIPDLYEAYRQGFDMVVGARRGSAYGESFGKRVLRLILKGLVQYAAGRKIADINSGLRIFSKKTVLPYFSNLCDTFSFTTSLTLAYMMTGRFVEHIPIDYRPRKANRTKVRLMRDSLRTMQWIIEAILFYNPIKIFILFSVGLAFLSAACFIISFSLDLTVTYLLGIGSALMSILTFGLGLLAVLVSKTLRTQSQLTGE